MITQTINNNVVIYKDKPFNIILIIGLLLALDIVLMLAQYISLIICFLFAIPLFLGYLITKETVTHINKDTLDVIVYNRFFFKTNVYKCNLKESVLDISYTSRFFKGNGVLLINKIQPLNSPDLPLFSKTPLEEIKSDLEKLKNQ